MSDTGRAKPTDTTQGDGTPADHGPVANDGTVADPGAAAGAHDPPAKHADPANEAAAPNGGWSWRARLQGLAAGAAIAAGIAFLLFKVDIFNPPAVAKAASAQEMWANSIRRLGIEPLYPPQEDFRVGDIWAVVATYKEDATSTREVDPQKSIIGRDVRIGRIDLNQLSAAARESPRFQESDTSDDGQLVYEAAQDMGWDGVAPGKVTTSIASFPRIDISTSSSDSGAVAQVGLAAARSRNETETVSIPVAETYSIPATAALAALANWCGGERSLCSEKPVRRLLAFVVNSAVAEDVDADRRYGFEIKLVTQVYMTRQMMFRRSLQESLSTSLNAPKVGAIAEEGGDGADDAAAGEVATESAQGADGSLENVIFPRPIVFGFRSVAHQIRPDASPADAEGAPGAAPAKERGGAS
ncbi:MAG TPA: hypothetical protein VGN97_15090 [Mesorhizobium sp.]|jgi:hypothetical protein|nr:hypothetical protein [Mesorhizobium sp.]